MALAKKVKKDFDKEKMYQKIMPSIAVIEDPPPLVTPGAAQSAPPKDVPEKAAKAQQAAPAYTVPEPEAPPAPTAPPAPKVPPAPVAIAAITAEDTFRLHNFMEDMAQEKLDHTIKVLGACTCARCKQDILALALNALPPAYAVAGDNGAYYVKKLRGAFEVKVTASLIKAIQQVKTQPRHSLQG